MCGYVRVDKCGGVMYVMMCRLEFDEEEQAGRLQEEETAESSNPEIITMPSRFEKTQDRGFIDVWWLYDDGGKSV